MEAIDGISKTFLALLARQLEQEKEHVDDHEDEDEQEEDEVPSLHAKMEELVNINQSLLEALDLSHPELQKVKKT